MYLTFFIVRLKVSRISDVTWNKQAFDSLVIDEDTKQCVKALVSNQLTAEKATDLVYGKGNGLVILLHGGPGTGKTLTAGKKLHQLLKSTVTLGWAQADCLRRAEGVAEIAEKPLLHVECGTIGTDPTKAEIALRSVLGLAKRWGCVVLLDEADIFLEERSLQATNHNVLVAGTSMTSCPREQWFSQVSTPL